MTICNDAWIRTHAEAGMITPFMGSLVRQLTGADIEGNAYVRKTLSFGISSYGYDLRLSPKEFWTFRHVPGTIVDPKAFNPANLAPVPLQRDAQGEYFVLPAHSYGLGVALEHFAMPPNVTAICLGKSTYARCGVIAAMTPAEAGWRGHLTLEFSNSSGADCRLYANEGIVQVLFFEGKPCDTCYETRSGKYQDQPERVVLARA